jgi:ComF family protein
MHVRVSGLASSLVEVVLPAPCLGCNGALPGGFSGLCAACQARLVPLSGTRCPTCAGPCDTPDEPCLACVQTPSPFTRMVAWGEYDDILRKAILAFKHHRHDELLEPLAARLAAKVCLEDWAARIDLVTAVPSHSIHRFRRGYTATELVGRRVAHSLRRPWRKTLRRHGVARQVGKTRRQRGLLARNRFSVHPRAHLTGKRLLVIDDVWTTGATLRLAARALQRGGAHEVYGAALAAAPDPRSFA